MKTSLFVEKQFQLLYWTTFPCNAVCLKIVAFSVFPYQRNGLKTSINGKTSWSFLLIFATLRCGYAVWKQAAQLVSLKGYTVKQLTTFPECFLLFRLYWQEAHKLYETPALWLLSVLHISAWQSRFPRICSALLCMLAKLPLSEVSP